MDIIEIISNTFKYVCDHNFEKASNKDVAFKDFCEYLEVVSREILPCIDSYMELMRHEKDYSKIHWVSEVKIFFQDFHNGSCLGGMPTDLKKRMEQSEIRLRSNIDILRRLINSNDEALNFD